MSTEHRTQAASERVNNLWCYQCETMEDGERCSNLTGNYSAFEYKCTGDKRTCMVMTNDNTDSNACWLYAETRADPPPDVWYSISLACFYTKQSVTRQLTRNDNLFIIRRSLFKIGMKFPCNIIVIFLNFIISKNNYNNLYLFFHLKIRNKNLKKLNLTNHFQLIFWHRLRWNSFQIII